MLIMMHANHDGRQRCQRVDAVDYARYTLSGFGAGEPSLDEWLLNFALEQCTPIRLGRSRHHPNLRLD